MDTILTVTEVADILKVKPITVREMFRDERIRGFKVGKAWRTTETMLQEDIERLARGEAPAKLHNTNGSANHTPKRKKKAAPVENGAQSMKEAPTVAPAAAREIPEEARETVPVVAEAQSPAREGATATAEKTRGLEESPQQMLF